MSCSPPQPQEGTRTEPQINTASRCTRSVPAHTPWTSARSLHRLRAGKSRLERIC